MDLRLRIIRRTLPAALVAALVLSVAAPAVPVLAGSRVGHPDDAPNQLTEQQDNAAEGHGTCGGEPVAPSGSRVLRRLIDGPRKPGTDELAFTSGVCIYLPPGYLTGTKRYPVLYLLHGAFGWQDDWFVQGDAQAILDRVRAGDPSKDMIVVTPDGGYDASWRDEADGSLQNETYVFDHVIPYIDRYFRTIDDRRGRALSGLSNGGAGTLRMAAHHPDYFTVVTAMSAATPVNTAANRSDIHAVHNDPTEVAANLNKVELALIYGLTCGTPEECAASNFGYAFENACCSNEVYAAKLDQVRRRPYLFERADGAHTWYFWQRWLEFTHGRFLRKHLVDPMPAGAALPPLQQPARFDFRSIDDVVGIYGYRFANDAERATEFLTLTDVRRGGLTLRGSGSVRVRTPARYVPQGTYTVTGAGGTDRTVVADRNGRLRFTVDLGPAHTAPEGSPEALAAQAAAGGDYWQTRAVTIAAQSR